ncbi:hypothetical protein D9M72_68690 [compost metagenome]
MMRWRKQPRETGLRAVLATGERSSYLRDQNGVRYACVSPLRGGGWYWVAGWDSSVPGINTSSAPVETEAQAKASAMRYVRQHLDSARQRG